MARYILGRLVISTLTVIGALVLVFVLTRVVGDPVSVLLPAEASQSEKSALTQRLGLDKPYTQQAYQFFRGAARGDFGDSWRQNRSALSVVTERLPRTFLLGGTAFLLALVLAVPIGVIAAWRAGTRLDHLLSTSVVLGICLPNFWVGLLLIMVFAVKLGWFPVEGAGTIKHLVLPAITLAWLPMGRIGQIVRSAVLDELGKQYVMVGRAKGLKEVAVLLRHALKNAMGPILTVSGWEFARMLAGYTVAVETVFNWPGLGHVIVTAISYQDFPVIQAVALMTALIIVAVNLATDMAYALFDPNLSL